MLIIADANELFSAIISRGKTLNLFFKDSLEIISPKFILKEFEKHRDLIIKKSGLLEQEILDIFLLLSLRIKFFDVEEFKDFLLEAKSFSPDPDDVEYFALALKLNCPIWSEDKLLKKQDKIRVLTTSELLSLI